MKVQVHFEERKLLTIVAHGKNNMLKRAGAYVRKSARNLVTRSTHSSLPGLPPHTRKGALKRSVLFGVEKGQDRVLIGPAATLIGISMTAHEFGGRYKGRTYPKRPLMMPVLLRTAPKLPALWKNAVRR